MCVVYDALIGYGCVCVMVCLCVWQYVWIWWTLASLDVCMYIIVFLWLNINSWLFKYLCVRSDLLGKNSVDMLRAMEVVNLKEDYIRTMAKEKWEKDEKTKVCLHYWILPGKHTPKNDSGIELLAYERIMEYVHNTPFLFCGWLYLLSNYSIALKWKGVWNHERRSHIQLCED